MPEKKLIDLYPYRLTDVNPEFLIFRRAKGKVYHKQWRMVGGKVKPGETYWQAALRELKEETAITPERLWTIPSINQFYEHSSDTIHSIPAFAAEVGAQEAPQLDDEHSDFKWIKAENVEKYILWPEQRRLIHLTNQIVTTNQILDDWLVPFQS